MSCEGETINENIYIDGFMLPIMHRKIWIGWIKTSKIVNPWWAFHLL